MGDGARPGAEQEHPLDKLKLPKWAWALLGLMMIVAGWWLLSQGGEPGESIANSPAAGSPTGATESPPPQAPQIDVAAQAELLVNQGQIEALICEFELIGTQGFSGKKLLDGSLGYRVELTIRAGDDGSSYYHDLRFGDETTDGQVSRGTGEPDTISIFESISAPQQDPFSCKLQSATVEGEAVEVTGTTEVTAD